MKQIKKIVPVIMAVIMVISLAGCGNKTTDKPSTEPQASASETTQASTSETAQASTSEATQASAFPKFHGTDFDGNEVDETIFSKNEVTLLNFWFNGCSACVNEMPGLEKLNKQLKEKGAELIGVNVLTAEDDEALKEAKDILSKQGVTYRNISIAKDSEAMDYITKIFGFPTTVMVDKNGNMIGDPIVGAIDDDNKVNEILKAIDDVKSGKEPALEGSSKVSDDKVNAILEEESKIFNEHKELWDKVFNAMDKSSTPDPSMSYTQFLQSEIDKNKDNFSENELNTLNEDLKKVDELEKQLSELVNNK